MGEREPEGLYVAVLSRWVAWVARHPWVTLACVAALTAASASVTVSRFAINSDTGDLIRQDAPFRERYEAFQDAFPQLEDTILAVVTADDLDRSTDAAERLAAALRARPDVFRSVHAPTLDPFFRSRALYYLEPEALEERVDALASAQPALAALTRDPSLRGLADLLRDALERGAPGDWPEGTGVLAERLARAAEGLLAGEPSPVSWTDALGAGAEFETFHLIVVQGEPDFEAPHASTRAIDALRAEARAQGLGPGSGVRVRLTGMVPLEHEELASAQRSVELAGSVSLVLLTLILGFGLRSLRLIVAALVSLGVGLSWTSAFALLAVGAFNPISVTFAVLFVGLGIDIAIHFGLRYLEELGGGGDAAGALQGATRGVGGAVSLCAVTSAVGFLSFVPTDYRGLADLGVIAGGGMLCALLASFTALPALLVGLGGGRRAGSAAGAPLARRVAPLVQRHARGIVLASLGLAAVAALFARDVRFDFSTLGLKNPRSEAMQTLRFLQARDVATDYALTVLAEPDEVDRLARRLRALGSVGAVRTPADEVPGAQAEKAALLDDARLLLGPALHPGERRPPPDAAERLASVRALRRAIAASDPAGQPEPLARALRRLGEALDALLARPDPAAELARWEALVTRFLDARLAWLRDALDAAPFAFEDLPASSRERLVAPDGRRRLVVIPRQDLSDFDALRAFLDEVTAVAPRATGRPVVEAGIGEIVVRAFRNALGIAAVCIALTLALVLRRVRDAALVLVPLGMAALFTLATGVLAGLPFNMANVIVLPLLLGLGVDNGVHVLLRFRQGGSFASVMASTTPRAVVLSSLTTLGAFGALSLSPHLGIRSMGILLSVGMLYLLLGTLVVLPALLAWVGGAGAPGGGPGGGARALPLPAASAPRAERLAGLRALAASPRVDFWLRYLGLFTAIATLERVALALSLWQGGREPEAAGTWLPAVVRGAADDVLTGVTVGIPFLVLLAAGPRRPNAAAALSALFTALWLFLALASLFFFGHFETRFNRLVIEYLAYPREAFGFLLETYRLALGLVPVAGIALVLESWLAPARRRALAAPRDVRACRRELALAGALAAAVWAAGSAPPAGDEGRVAEHLARNPLHALGRALAADPSRWNLSSLPADRALSLARASLPGENGAFVGPALERRVEGRPGAARPDLVLVIEESLGMRQALARDASGEPLAPNLLGLAARGRFFPHVYATGTRTARGLEALLTGFPPLLGPPAVRRPEGRGMHSLASVLARAGYETAFLYPGHARFDDLGPFCRSAGFDHVWDLRDFAEPGFTTVWGADDASLFDEALRRLDARGPDAPPLFLALLTVSNHPPYRLPPGAGDALPGATDAERAVAYADRALGDFVRRVLARPGSADTVLGVVADHGADSRGAEAIPLASYRVPFAVLAPGRVAPGTDPVMGSSVDVGPTLLGVLGIPYESPFFGVDLRRVPPGAGRALLSHFEALGRLDRDGLVVLRPGREALRYPLRDASGLLGAPVPAGAEARDRALGVFQTAHRLLQGGRYRPSPASPPTP